MSVLIGFFVFLACFIALGINRAPLVAWAVAGAGFVLAGQTGVFSGDVVAPTFTALWTLAWVPVLVLAALAVPAIRSMVLVRPAFGIVRRILPKVSETEQAALDAGTVGFDAEIFSGAPDWSKLREIPAIELTAEEQEFLDGPTEELCALIDDWDVRHNAREIPEEVWAFVKRHGFLGMLISKEHGGLGFSAQAQSLILGKIASRSPDVSTIVMVPNSLGPGELIEKYGTDQQKSYYLPRLANGQEIPCFSLTGPRSGSDAATMRDVGVVCRGMHDGEEVLGIRLHWQKRYITLGPVATLVGLAFDLRDPDGLIGDDVDVGITVALIPADHPGVKIGRRHLPSGAAFPNGPNWGSDVFIPMSFLVGGQDMAGQGWRMLMECLAAGRAISLPASAAAATKQMLRTSTAYGRIRKQFGLPVAKMQGVEEPLVRMAENAYVVEAARGVTAAMVSRGDKPAVISALMKYQTTEKMRQSVNDAMDLHGGKAICDGPSNYLQSAYQMMPVAITVEGANILTRTLITFAQGALRSHPFLYEEIKAAQSEDRAAGLKSFERAFLGHIGFAVSNVTGALFHNLTGGLFAKAPAGAGEVAVCYKQISRASRNFALVADMSVAMLGGGLKTKQRLTGRLADALSELYLLSCVMKRFEDDGRPDADFAMVELAMANGLNRFERAMHLTIDNFPSAPVRLLLNWVVFPFGRHYDAAPDHVGHDIVRRLLVPGEFRDRMTPNIYVSSDPADPLGQLEVALEKAVALEDAERKLDRAVRAGTVQRYHDRDWFADAVSAGVLTTDEADGLRELEALTDAVIAVDDFEPAEVKPNYMSPGHNRQPAGSPLAAE